MTEYNFHLYWLNRSSSVVKKIVMMDSNNHPDNRNTCLPTFNVTTLFEILSTDIVTHKCYLFCWDTKHAVTNTCVAVFWHTGNVIFNKCYMNVTYSRFQPKYFEVFMIVRSIILSFPFLVSEASTVREAHQAIRATGFTFLSPADLCQFYISKCLLSF